MTHLQCKELAKTLKENLKLPVSGEKLELEILYYFFFGNEKHEHQNGPQGCDKK